MTTRLKGVLVTFEDDIREDDAAARVAAIRQIRGVLSVEPVIADRELRCGEHGLRACSMCFGGEPQWEPSP